MDQFEWTWTVCEHIGAGLQVQCLLTTVTIRRFPSVALADWQSLQRGGDSHQIAEAWRFGLDEIGRAPNLVRLVVEMWKNAVCRTLTFQVIGVEGVFFF